MDKRKKSLTRNTAILAFGTFCTKGIMFFMAPLFTRWLSASEYGIFDLVSEYTALAVPILTLSTGEAIFRFLVGEEDERKQNEILSTNFFVHLIGIVITIIIGGIASLYWSLQKETIIAILIYISTEILYKFAMMTIRGKRKLDSYTIANILLVLCVTCAVTFFVYICKLGLAGIIIGYACGDIIAIIYMSVKSSVIHNIKKNCFNYQTLKMSLKYSLPLVPQSIAWWIVNVSDRTIITLFLGTSFNGIYAIANKIPSFCQNFFTVFHISWQQSAIESLSDTDRDQYYSSVLNDMICVMGSICILILGFNYWFFKILFTETYFPGYYQAPILVMSILFSSITQFYGSIYVARMETKINGITTSIAAVANIILHLAMIRDVGLYAASISTLATYVILFVIRHLDIRNKVQLRMENKSISVFIIAILMSVQSYINWGGLKYLSVIVGTLFFCYINKDYIVSAVKKAKSVIKSN